MAADNGYQTEQGNSAQTEESAYTTGAGRKDPGQSEGAKRVQKGSEGGTLMENRKRNVHLHVMVTSDELAVINERMTETGISNAGAYVRKMALNGYISHIDLAPIKELIFLQRWLFKQSQSGCHIRAYLWRMPEGNRWIEAGL